MTLLAPSLRKIHEFGEFWAREQAHSKLDAPYIFEQLFLLLSGSRFLNSQFLPELLSSYQTHFNCFSQKFEKKFQSEQAAGSVSKSTQFEYAWCLVRSKYNDDIRKGIALLEELLPKGSKEEQRDYVFYLAVGNYRLKEYEKALKYVRGLLQTEPQNNQAKELERLIDKAMKKDGLVGMAIVGGMALGVAGLAGLIGLAVSKSKS
ncbi:mitochondrial fission 1 protein isoform X1 [Cavia porcellus]|uniref:mitochondrial fission 1 protein isoform X1 n=1 Tax=Cavia porcellus TaxID=10141 RepID=UPI00035113B1|nr:mitochondrial fission 1 protein isoform X1 [Cavia porcellus]